MEDYARLTAASESGDIIAVEEARKALIARIRDEAKAVSKYINLPDTTPFAILYLATEGLYAEAYSVGRSSGEAACGLSYYAGKAFHHYGDAELTGDGISFDCHQQEGR